MLTHMLTSRVKKIKTSYKFWTSKIQKNLKRRQKDAQCCQVCLCSATFCPLPLPFLPLSALSRILPSNHFSLSLSNTHTHTHTHTHTQKFTLAYCSHIHSWRADSFPVSLLPTCWLLALTVPILYLCVNFLPDLYCSCRFTVIFVQMTATSITLTW